MSMYGRLLVGLSALLTVASNLMLRAGVRRAGGLELSRTRFMGDLARLVREPLCLVGLALYAVAAVVWIRVISTENLTTSYPTLVGLTFVLITAGSIAFFHEPVSWPRALGMGLILMGVVVVSRV